MSGNVSFGQTILNPGEVSAATGKVSTDDSQNMGVWKASDKTPGVGVTPGGGAEFAIPHRLTYVPVTLLGWDTDNGGVLYRGTTPWTAMAVPPQAANPSIPSETPVGHIYLKCTLGGAHFNVIFG